MATLPTGRELARPFLPARDLERSRRFHEALGFERLRDGDVALFRLGGSGFILQRHDSTDGTGHCLMQRMVDDLQAWWAHLQGLDPPGRFAVPPPRPPALQPWGLRVA